MWEFRGVWAVFALKTHRKWVPLLSMEEEKCFYLVCMGVTAEVEMRGHGTWPEMDLGQRAQKDLHLGVIWDSKIKLCQSWCIVRLSERRPT